MAYIDRADAGPRLAEVAAPTSLIVGGRDDVVLDLKCRAQARFGCESGLVVVARAAHLFEETGALQATAEVACDWITSHLVDARHTVGSP